MLSRMRWLLLLLAACTAPYRTSMLPASGVRLGCVDVWVQAGVRSEAQGPVVVVHLGNPCDHSARVDLGSVHVIGLDEAGGTWPLAPYDPDHEIEPRRIDAFTWGEEWIEYHAAEARSFAWLDVDVGSIERPGPARWVRIEVPR